MAPIIKTTLTLLSVSASVISVVNAQHNNNIANAAQHHGKHLKLAKRTLFEDLGKREHEFAPYGYDRCGYILFFCVVLPRTDLVHFILLFLTHFPLACMSFAAFLTTLCGEPTLMPALFTVT